MKYLLQIVDVSGVTIRGFKLRSKAGEGEQAPVLVLGYGKTSGLTLDDLTLESSSLGTGFDIRTPWRPSCLKLVELIQ